MMLLVALGTAVRLGRRPEQLRNTEPMDGIESELAAALREERVRQLRDKEPETWPGGPQEYEEYQAPWLEARVALRFLLELGLLKFD